MIEVGEIRASERLAWESLFRGYNAFYERELSGELMSRAWQEFTTGARMHAFGARMSGSLVGIAHFLVHASTTSADVCYLQDLFTLPSARGHGVGRALILAVSEWARDQGCSRLYWHTKEDNHGARRLYDQVAEHRGFIHYVMPF